MKRTILLTITALCMALQVMTAQTKSNDNYKYHKALEILDKDGDPAEARKLLVENIKENPKHIHSYMVMAAIDRDEKDYASALHVLNEVDKINYKGSGIPESEVLWWRASIYSDMEDSQTAVTLMEMQSSRMLKHQWCIARRLLFSSVKVFWRSSEQSQ